MLPSENVWRKKSSVGLHAEIEKKNPQKRKKKGVGYQSQLWFNAQRDKIAGTFNAFKELAIWKQVVSTGRRDQQSRKSSIACRTGACQLRRLSAANEEI